MIGGGWNKFSCISLNYIFFCFESIYQFEILLFYLWISIVSILKIMTSIFTFIWQHLEKKYLPSCNLEKINMKNSSFAINQIFASSTTLGYSIKNIRKQWSFILYLNSKIYFQMMMKSFLYMFQLHTIISGTLPHFRQSRI